MVAAQTGIELEALSYDEASATHRGEFDPETTPPSMAVVATLAAVDDIDPVEVEPLYETVDTDALDAVVSNGTDDRGDISVTLHVNGYALSVSSDGQVACRSRQGSAGPADAGAGDQR